MKSLHKILSLHCKKINKTIVQIRSSSDEELIHDFRVQFKKIRAIIRLTGNLKTPSPLKNLYAAAGKVRELQLLKNQLQKIQPVDGLSQFYNFINQQIYSSLECLKNIAVNDYKKDLEMLVANADDYLTVRQVKKFTHKKTEDLKKIFQLPRKTDKSIHDARKIIKDLVYSFHTLEETGVDGFYLSPAEKEFLLTISTELGIFQDWCTIISHLSLTKLRSIPTDEKLILKKIREGFLKAKQEARSIILPQLNEKRFSFVKTGG
ncbi:MAG: CHAD domain-containing protein [Sphingobacteriales bacterium]|nr:MAG: CHAD domain-containing protein [Sphingobacteriales bacterium]